MTDEEFIRVCNAALAWARDFRLPEDWWRGDNFKKSVARQARERVQREIPRIVRDAVARRNGGDVVGSEAVIAHIREYSQRMQRLTVQLQDRSARDVRTLFADAAAALRNSVVSTYDAAAEGVQAAARSMMPTAALVAGAVFLIHMLWNHGGRR